MVTGGGGFLGSSICRQLAASGHEVVAYQRSPADHLAPHGVISRQGDINDQTALRNASEGCDAVIHTAGKAGIWGDPADYERVNVAGTANVIDTCREQHIDCLVHTSSPSVVHTGGDIEGADESLPLADHFKAPYPASKARAEALIVQANGPDLKTVALRPHLIWGPGDPHILPRLLSKVRRGKLLLPGPDKVIDTIFVENAALAHLKALEELANGGACAGKAYFVTNNEPMRQREIIARLLEAVGVPVEIKPVPLPLAMLVAGACELIWRTLRLRSEPPVTRFSVEQLATAHWYDTRAAERDFGYRPVIPIAAALKTL